MLQVVDAFRRDPRCRAALVALALVCAPATPGCRRGPEPQKVAGDAAAPRSVQPVIVSRPRAASSGELSVASVFPTVGRFARSGTESHRGVQMAVSEINAAGGIHGRLLHLMEYDTGSFFLDAREAAQRAEAQGALAIVGSNSSAHSEAMAEVAETRHIVQVSNVSTAPDLTWDPATGRDRPYVFRMCGSDLTMGALLADFARDTLGARRAAVLYEIGRTFSVNLTRSFVARFRNGNGQRTTAEFVYLPLETDFRPQLERARAFGAEVLLLPGSFTDATLVAAQAEQMGFRPTLLGGDGWASPLLFKRGHLRGRAYYGNHCALPRAFAARYRERFGEDTEGCRALLSFDAVLALAQALSDLGPLDDADLGPGLPETREQLRARLSAVETEGASGPLQFDENGDIERGISITEVAIADGQPRPRELTWMQAQ
jgi:branched-chain amino acid transport system substrate-binding protein